MADGATSWPRGGGDAVALLREPGFEAAGLGPIAAWSDELIRALDLIFASEQRMLLVWGPERAYFYNDAIMRDYPQNPPRPQGKRYADNFPSIMPQFGPFLDRGFGGEGLWFDKLRVEGMQPEMWVSASFTPIRDRTGSVAGLLCVMIDQSAHMLTEQREHAAIAAAQLEIERRREVEERLRHLNEELESRVQAAIAERQAAEAALQQAQKMETIGKLTGGVAHDFNNLLQVISGNLQLLARDVIGNAKAEARIANALAGVTRGSKLASQLLAFGRRQPLEPRVLNMGKFLAGMDDMLRRALGEEIEIEIAADEGVWNTLADPAQVENAVLNLAINARDAMSGVGRLTIAASNAVLDKDYVRGLPDVAAGQYVLLEVTDTGCGMPREIIEQAFEPFFSTKPEGKGTGLGLSMVYGFAKQSGGHVKLESEPGEGTTARLYLPRVRGREHSVVAPDDLPADGGSETVLVAEDDADVRATVVELLSELGYRVIKAEDAQEALDLIEGGAKVDLLFTDVVMPGKLKSTELARRARKRLPGLAVLFTSGYAEDAIVHDGKLDKGVELLSKPYTREALARKVRAVLAARVS